MQELKASQFKAGMKLQYRRTDSEKTSVVTVEYHVKVWFMRPIEDGPHESNLRIFNHLVISGPYAHVKAIRSYRKVRSIVDALHDARIMGLDTSGQ